MRESNHRVQTLIMKCIKKKHEYMNCRNWFLWYWLTTNVKLVWNKDHISLKPCSLQVYNNDTLVNVVWRAFCQKWMTESSILENLLSAISLVFKGWQKQLLLQKNYYYSEYERSIRLFILENNEMLNCRTQLSIK